MRTKLLFKSLLVAAGLCAGASNVWAQVTSYSNDYEDETPIVDWTSNQTGRYTVAVEGTTDHYLHVGAVGNGNNGATITCSATNKKVTAGTDFYMSFDLILEGGNTSGQHSCFYIYDTNNSSSTPILKIYQNNGGNYTEWTINDNTAFTTGGKGTGNWYNYVLTRIGSKEYLTVTKKSNSSKVLDMVEITNLSSTGGLGNMQFGTAKYYAGMYIDNVVLRTLATPAFTLSATDVAPAVGGNTTVSVTGITGTVTVSSDNPSAATATYSDGTITINGVADGVANITVTSVNDGAKTTQTIVATVGTVSTTNVTVNYLDESSNAIATQLVLNDVTVGSTLTASEVVYSDVLYGTGCRYVNPVLSETLPYTVVENGVINITYTTQAAVTNVKKIVKAGATEVSNENVAQDGKYVGDEISFSFPAYINYSGTLYSKAANSKTYNQSFTLTENNQECVFTYSATSITNVVYFSEGESVTGATSTSAGNNMSGRSSNQACGYAESDLTLVNLPAGCYKTTAVLYSNSSGGTTVNFQYGDDAYDAVVSGANNAATDTHEFSFSSAADVKWLTSGDNKNGVDYLYIQSIDKVTTAAIPTSTYGTIASAYALDCANLPAGLEAYKVTSITASAVTLEQVTEAVAAGTGLILKGTASTPYEIPVVATGSDISATNKLQAAVTTTDVAADEAYILKDGKFHLVNAASTVPAGKAYLLASDVPSDARSLNFVFDEAETTGINEELRMKNEESSAATVYNLNGQRVAQPTRGLYIVNGKKIVVK